VGLSGLSPIQYIAIKPEEYFVMSDLVVIEFPSENKAEEVREKLLDMQKEYLIELEDAVIAIKKPNGRIKLGNRADWQGSWRQSDHAPAMRMRRRSSRTDTLGPSRSSTRIFTPPSHPPSQAMPRVVLNEEEVQKDAERRDAILESLK
jgi:hypothetical protein